LLTMVPARIDKSGTTWKNDAAFPALLTRHNSLAVKHRGATFKFEPLFAATLFLGSMEQTVNVDLFASGNIDTAIEHDRNDESCREPDAVATAVLLRVINRLRNVFGVECI
jgi:hypothetical protein